jgi:hypothetical protein
LTFIYYGILVEPIVIVVVVVVVVCSLTTHSDLCRHCCCCYLLILTPVCDLVLFVVGDCHLRYLLIGDVVVVVDTVMQYPIGDDCCDIDYGY